MSFISISFAILFLILVILYHLTARVAKNPVLIQNILLLAASLVFYAFADFRYLPFLFYIIIISYIAGKFCKNKTLFILFLIVDIAPLFAIKCCPLIFHTHWIFPLGISFFTFQSISYIVDTYTKKIPSEKNLLNVALFISFFPIISSGPIQRAGNLIPQFQNVRTFDYNNATDGMKLFAWGMFKKLCIADRIAVYVNYVYGNVNDGYGVAILLATVLYSFQIYCDFSGYSDMAIGIARYLGFDVGKNFDHPYLSKSVGEFWRRWHISLSSWLRDYVYIPLGGSRVALPRIYLNILITFLVSGIWHGSTWNFVIWGLLHGIFQCIGRATKSFWERIKVPSIIRIFITFCLVTFAWIFFRAENLHEAGIVISKIAQVPQNISQFFVIKGNLGMKEAIRVLFALNDGNFGGFPGMALLCLLMCAFLFCELITQKKDGLIFIKQTTGIIRWSIYIILIMSLICFGNFGLSSNFIYNNF
ncbi:MAG: MBOAT family O-acyltransferase [Treponema sp.]|nr:MBOAT family O-acyltransferase [Treponema sp.]